MKKCCENKDDHLESNWSFDPCDKERGYKIKRLIDECSGDYIYPVTSLDSVIININTLDADTKACLLSKQSDPCDRNVEITLRDLIESGCLVTGTECTELISGGKIILTKYGKYVLLLYYENGDTLDIDITDVFGDPFIDAVWNEDNNTLTLERNSGKNPFIALIKDKNQQIDKINYNSDGSVSIIQNNGDPTVISQNESKIFMPGYYRTILKYNPYIQLNHDSPDPFPVTDEELPINYNDGKDSTITNLFPLSETDKARYLGVSLASNTHPTVWYPHIYKVTSSTSYSLQLSLLLPHDDYVYVVSTGYCYSKPTGEIAYFYGEVDTDSERNPENNPNIIRPKLKVLCNFRQKDGKICNTGLSPTEFTIESPFLFGPSAGAEGYTIGVNGVLSDSNYPTYTDAPLRNQPNYAPTVVINEDSKTQSKNLVRNRTNIYYFINILNQYNGDPIVLEYYKRNVDNGTVPPTITNVIGQNGLIDKLSDRYKYLFAFPINTREGTGEKYITIGQQVLTRSLTPIEAQKGFFNRTPNMYYNRSRDGENYVVTYRNKKNNNYINSYDITVATKNNDGKTHDRNNTFRNISDYIHFYDYNTWKNPDPRVTDDNDPNYQTEEQYAEYVLEQLNRRNLAVSILLGFAFGCDKEYPTDSGLYKAINLFTDGVGWSDDLILYNFKMYDSNIELMGVPGDNYWNDDDMIEHSRGIWLLSISNGKFTLNAELTIDIGDINWNITSVNGEFYSASNLDTRIGFIPHAIVTKMNGVCTYISGGIPTTQVITYSQP